MYIHKYKYKMKASEPAPAYNTASFQALKDRIIASVNTETDESKFEQCLAILHDHEMPGIYTNEEFKEELRLSEANGFISHEEALAEFAKWGFVK